MNDTVKTARETVVKTKVTFKDLGAPQKLLTLPETVQALKLGTIVGIATGIKTGKMPDQMTEWKGLKGSFKATPADETMPIVRSGVCLLGDAFQGDIVGMIEEDGLESVSFGFDVFVVRATNATKYTWALKPLLAATEADPLAILEKQIADQNAPAQIEAPAKK